MKKRNVIIVISISLILVIFALVFILNRSAAEKNNEVNYSLENTVDNQEKLLTQEEAKEVLINCYEKALGIYAFSFNTLNIEDSNSKLYNHIQLSNFYSVMDDNFTSSGIEQFKTFYKDYVIQEDNKVYILNDSNLRSEYSYSIEFKDIKIQNDRITCKAISKYEYDNSKQNKEEEFIITRDINVWKVDFFVRPY